MEEELDAAFEEEQNLVEIAEKMKERTTEPVSEKLKMELTGLDTLKQTVRMEIESRIKNLTIEYQKWKSYNENRGMFEEWLKETEKELKTLSTTAIDLLTPKKFQVIFRKMLTFPLQAYVLVIS